MYITPTPNVNNVAILVEAVKTIVIQKVVNTTTDKKKTAIINLINPIILPPLIITKLSY